MPFRRREVSNLGEDFESHSRYSDSNVPLGSSLRMIKTRNDMQLRPFPSLRVSLRCLLAATLVLASCRSSRNKTGQEPVSTSATESSDTKQIREIVTQVATEREASRKRNRLSGSEASAVERVVLAKAAVYSEANPKADVEAVRKNMSSQFYSYSDPKLPYFTPVTPIVPDAKTYIEDLNTTMEWYQAQGVRFRVEIGDILIRQKGNMAVSVGTMTSVLTFPDGTTERNPSRWTVVLEKEGGSWLSIHEHLSFYDGAVQTNSPVKKYRQEVEQLRKTQR